MTTMYITLSQIRKHLNLDDFYTEDDEYLKELIKVSEDATEKRIGKPLSKCIDNNGELEPSIKHSILLLTATYYNNRESVAPVNIHKLPMSFDFLADLNKQYFIN